MSSPSKLLFIRKSVQVVLLFFLFSCEEPSENLEINKHNFYQKLEESYSDYVINYDGALFDRVQLYIEGDNIELKSSYHQALYLYLTGSQYYNFGDYVKAKKYFQQAKSEFLLQTEHKEKLAVCYNDLGLIANNEGNIVLSLKLFNTALKYYDENKDFTGLAETHYNIAKMLERNEHDWLSVRNHGNKTLSIINKHLRSSEIESYIYSTICRAEIELGNFSVADSLLAVISKRTVFNNHRESALLYKIKGRFYKKVGDSEKSSDYLLQALHHVSKQRLQNIKKLGKHRQTLLEFNTTLYTQKLNTIAEQKKLMLLGAAIIVLVILFVIYYKRLNAQIKRKSVELNKINSDLKIALEEKNRFNQALEISNTKIEDLLFLNNRTLYSKQLRLSVINEKIKSISKIISTLTFEDGMISSSRLLAVNKQMQEVLTGDEEIWEDFKTHFEEIRPSFFDNLRVECPSLSVSELKHCSYIVSHLRTKDVAKLINVSPRSVETARYRIKKKIGLEQNESLLDFLARI